MTDSVKSQGKRTPWTVPIKCNVSKTKITTKPTKGNNLIATISNELASESSERELDLQTLLDFVKKGHSITEAHLHGGRSAKDFAGQYVLMIDIDNNIQGLPFCTTDDFKKICKEQGLSCAAIYFSLSHTPEKPKFRAIFVLNAPIFNPDIALKVKTKLIGLFPQADPKTKNLAGFFFPSSKKHKILRDLNADFVTAEHILSLPDAASGPPTSTAAIDDDPYFLDLGSEGTELIKQFPLMDFFLWYGKLQGFDVSSTGTEKYIMYDTCPICGHQECFRVYTDRWNCFSASRPENLPEGGNIYHFLHEVLGYPKAQSWEYIKRAIDTFTQDKSFPPLPSKEDTKKQNLKKGKDDEPTIEKILHDYVLQKIGLDNLIFQNGNFYKCGKDNVWRELKVEKIKKVCQGIAFNAGFKRLKPFHIQGAITFLQNSCWEDIQFNTINPLSIPLKNGLLAMNPITFEWSQRPYKREDYILGTLDLEYDPEAKCAIFDRFMGDSFKSDADCLDKIQLVKEMIIYSLMADTSLETFFFLFGEAQTGKSQTLNIIKNMLGLDLIACVMPSKLDNPFQLAFLANKRGNFIFDMPENETFAAGKLKSATSGEPHTGEPKHKPPFTFNPYCTFIFASNHLARTSDFSKGLIRRTRFLQFNNQVPPGKRDNALERKLKAELPGILNQVLEAGTRLYKRGQFVEPQSHFALVNEWRISNDSTRAFIEELCTLGAGLQTPFSELYEAYKLWTPTMGIRPLGYKNFSTRLSYIDGVTKDRDNNTRFFYGIALNSNLAVYEWEGL